MIILSLSTLCQRVIGFAGWNVFFGAIVVNENGNGFISSTVIPPTSGTDTISTMYSQFTLSSGVVSNVYYPNTNNLCGYNNSKILRAGDYSGAAIDGNTAYVVAMAASSDVCTDTITTNWQSIIMKIPLQ
jgi:hypothetical protein